jgi:hypothetical protein
MAEETLHGSLVRLALSAALQSAAATSVLWRMHEYKKSRGMNMFTDIRDWLGGWSMEFVHDKDAVSFCKELGFRLQRMVTGEANTEFLFIRSASPK